MRDPVGILAPVGRPRASAHGDDGLNSEIVGKLNCFPQFVLTFFAALVMRIKRIAVTVESAEGQISAGDRIHEPRTCLLTANQFL